MPDQIVEATTPVCLTITSYLRLPPAEIPHYTLNLRALSQVYQRIPHPQVGHAAGRPAHTRTPDDARM